MAGTEPTRVTMKPETGDKTITVTREDVASGLKSVGVAPGDVVIFHSSLSSMGNVVGGADTVIDGFIDAVGPEGTVAAPTLWFHSADPPLRWEDWDIATSPAYIGLVSETFRRRPDSIRSNHPSHSVSAIGRRARELTRDHGKSGERLCVFGDGAFARESPWEKLYQWNAAYCFIGVDFTVCTMRHYIESVLVEEAIRKAPESSRESLAARVKRRGKDGVWPNHSSRLMGERFSAMGLVQYGKIGSATLRCIRARDMVDAALDILKSEPEEWFDEEFLSWFNDALGLPV